jgi:hypothetical protein
MSIRHLTLTLTLASLASAQNLVPVPPGTQQFTTANPNAAVSAPLPLGFAFPMPGGATVTTIEIDTNGRIAGGGSLLGSALGTVFGLLQGPPSICPCWDNLNSPTVFLDTTSVPTTAVVTFQNATLTGSPFAPFTFQVQLAANGNVTFVYDDRVTAQLESGIGFQTVVGLSPGQGALGAPDPGELDYTELAVGESARLGATVYEFFDFFTPNNVWDLAVAFNASTMAITYTLRADGGYDVTTSLATRGRADRGRPACRSDAGWTILPSGQDFLLSPGAAFDGSAMLAGTDLRLGDEAVSVPLQTSFPIMFPGGLTTTLLEVESNGRVLPGGSGSPPNPTPSAAELLASTVPLFAPFWADLDPGAGGRVRAFDSATKVVITWQNVPQSGAPANENTFQVQFFPDGSFAFAYQDLDFSVAATPDPASGAVVGLSPGGGAVDPGESDLGGQLTLSSGPAVYEFFEQGVGDTLDLTVDLPDDGLRLVVASPPTIGDTLALDVLDRRGTSTLALYFLGLPSGTLVPGLPLALLSPALDGCDVLVDLVTPGALLASPSGPVGTPTTALSIPNATTLIGLDALGATALVFDPSRVPAFAPTEELLLRIGQP